MADERDAATLTAPHGAAGFDPRALHPGARLGRYHVRELLGAGGMGVVFLAEDPSLKRTVAIKILYPGLRVAANDDRMLEEGRVLAQLSHPNVIHVYDVGQEGAATFVAMEHVRGTTLKGWLEQGSRGVGEIVDAFLQAGQGLAAAHAAGLVHRDFKPSNVMVDTDGRVLVTDFGLARQVGTGPGALTLAALELTASQAGTGCGTPAYMSPEQHAGEHVDARSDVFSFCVSLWWVLYRQAPFRGDTWAELAEATRRGHMSEPGETRGVPRHVRAALERGLRADPAERWPSMAPLLAALRGRPVRGRRSLVALAAVVALVAVLVVTWQAAAPRVLLVGPCAATPDRFIGVWDAAGRARLRSALLASGGADALPSFEALAGGIDRRLVAWEAMRRGSCEATRVRHEQSEAALDLRGGCLDRQLAELAAFTQELRSARPQVLSHAIDALSRVGDVEVCADAAVLARRMPLPSNPARRRAIAALEARALELRAAIGFDVPLGGGRAAALLAEARALAYPPLTALALYVVGKDAATAVASAAAEAALGEGALEAEAGGDDALRFDLELALGRLVGLDLERFDDGRRHLDEAQALARRLGSGARSQAGVLDAQANLELRRGRLDEAERLARAAVARCAQAPGAEVDCATYVTTLGGVLVEAQRLDEALRVLAEALAVLERELGPRHPRVAAALLLAAGAQRGLKHFDEAERDLVRARDVYEQSFGPDALNTGIAWANLGLLHDSLRRFDEAERELRRAYDISARTYGKDHSRTMRMLYRLGVTLVRAGHFDEAQATLAAALDGLRKTLGDKHRFVSDVYLEQGFMEDNRHRPRLALDAYERAAATLRAGEGPSSRLLRRVYSGMGDSYTDLGQFREACKAYRAAAAVLSDAASDAAQSAGLELQCADALYLEGARAEARLAAGTARGRVALIGPPGAAELAEIDDWLATHPPGR